MMRLSLFWVFLQIGAFSVGGGYAAMPLIQRQVCQLHPWLTAEEFSHLLTIAEMTPGPIAINAATFVGTRLAGLPGAVTATLGCILPSCVIVSLLSLLYRKYRDLPRMQAALAALRPVVAALIFSAGLSLLKTAVLPGPDLLQAGLFLGAFFLLGSKKANPICTMLACGGLYLLLHFS